MGKNTRAQLWSKNGKIPRLGQRTTRNIRLPVAWAIALIARTTFEHVHKSLFLIITAASITFAGITIIILNAVSNVMIITWTVSCGNTIETKLNEVVSPDLCSMFKSSLVFDQNSVPYSKGWVGLEKLFRIIIQELWKYAKNKLNSREMTNGLRFQTLYPFDNRTNYAFMFRQHQVQVENEKIVRGGREKGNTTRMYLCRTE